MRWERWSSGMVVYGFGGLGGDGCCVYERKNFWESCLVLLKEWLIRIRRMSKF